MHHAWVHFLPLEHANVTHLKNQSLSIQDDLPRTSHLTEPSVFE